MLYKNTHKMFEPVILFCKYITEKKSTVLTAIYNKTSRPANQHPWVLPGKFKKKVK